MRDLQVMGHCRDMATPWVGPSFAYQRASQACSEPPALELAASEPRSGKFSSVESPPTKWSNPTPLARLSGRVEAHTRSGGRCRPL